MKRTTLYCLILFACMAGALVLGGCSGGADYIGDVDGSIWANDGIFNLNGLALLNVRIQFGSMGGGGVKPAQASSGLGMFSANVYDVNVNSNDVQTAAESYPVDLEGTWQQHGNQITGSFSNINTGKSGNGDDSCEINLTLVNEEEIRGTVTYHVGGGNDYEGTETFYPDNK